MPELAKAAPLSGNGVIDGLMLGGAWSGPTITYSFLAGDINNNGISDFNEGDWKAFYKEIMGNVESFANVNFQESTMERANINFRLDEGGGGESGVPVSGTRDVETAVGINPDVAGAAAVVRLGTYSVTWFHEIGHALGLKHPHDDEGGAFPKLPGVVNPGDQGTTYLNSQTNTVMGYTFSFLAEDNPFTPAVDFGTQVNAQPGSYGAIDIAALQHLYGARDHNTGNDTYRFSDDVDFNHGYTTIWDTGGSDTIEYMGSSRTKIDLRAATLQNEIGGGGWVSTSETLTGGFTIANKVTIENARGGGNDDILIGNDVANVLAGLGGNDTLRGGAGDDRLDGGAGNDTLDGGTGTDSAVYRGAFANYALRMEGVTTIVIGEGTDRLTNIENAIFSDGVYDLSRRVFESTVTIPTNALNGTEGVDTLRATSSANWTINGRGGNDVLTGNNGNDRLDGGAGNDRLDGQGGADTMVGGTGDDTYVVDNTRDLVVEYTDQGSDTVEASVSYTLSSGVENLTLTGIAGINGVGNSLANVLTGNGADNNLSGGDGNDTLFGGVGNDTLSGDAGNDVLVGGAGNDRLDGGTGNDAFFGGTGNDTYIVDVSTERVIELAGEGTDTVQASTTFKLQGNLENLILTGRDAINGTGNFQSNILIGNSAANVLNGSGGKDMLTGGGGNDTFVFRAGETNGDKVMDFTGAGTAVGDHLEFYGFGTGATLSHTAGTSFYTIKADAAHGGLSETFQLVGVTNLDLGTGVGHNDVMLFA